MKRTTIIVEIGILIVAGLASIFLRFSWFPLPFNQVVYPKFVLINGVLTSCSVVTCYPGLSLNQTYVGIDTVFWFVFVFLALSLAYLAYSKSRKSESSLQTSGLTS